MSDPAEQRDTNQSVAGTTRRTSGKRSGDPSNYYERDRDGTNKKDTAHDSHYLSVHRDLDLPQDGGMQQLAAVVSISSACGSCPVYSSWTQLLIVRPRVRVHTGVNSNSDQTLTNSNPKVDSGVTRELQLTPSLNPNAASSGGLGALQTKTKARIASMSGFFSCFKLQSIQDLLDILRCKPTKEAVAAAFTRWSVEELEVETSRQHLYTAALRSYAKFVHEELFVWVSRRAKLCRKAREEAHKVLNKKSVMLAGITEDDVSWVVSRAWITAG
ncbi:hypothetical protein BJY52DRAFT_1379890 [Lactarius psammicola]|nr:hypothetical protein BJY52DRAFT_1379890 [Lactarius psammicola]